MTTPENYKIRMVKEYLDAQIGAPIIQPIDSEVDAYMRSMNLALPLYWQAFPWVFMDNFKTSYSGNIRVSVPDILERCILDPEIRKNAYVLGVTRIDSSPLGVMGGANLDSYLLGVPVYQGSGSSCGSVESYMTTPADSINQAMLYQAQMSFYSGQIEWQMSPDRDEILFITPAMMSSIGQLTVFFGFGFTDEAGVKFLRPHQIDLFRKMAAVEFINMIINARGQIRFNGDFTINLEQLTARRLELKTEVDKEISDTAVFPLMWS
jgi:hypothetical protein